MTKRLDHEKVSKLATVRKRGGEGISRDDQTLPRNGYPSARDMANSPPRRRPPGLDVSPLTYKQEPLDVAVREARRLEAEKAVAKAQLKEKRRIAGEARLAGEARRKAAHPLPTISRSPPRPTNMGGPAPITVQQALPRARATRAVLVEVKRSSSAVRPRRGGSQDQTS